MKLIPQFKELSITLFAKEIIPTFITSKFLKESQIIPQEWEFAQPPEIDAQTGKVKFTNDIIISARIGTVTISETFTFLLYQNCKLWKNRYCYLNVFLILSF